MANYYEDKQYHREKELNSRRGTHQFDERKHESRQNKRAKLIQENDDDDFYPVNSSISYAEHPSWSPASSTSSDDDTMNIDHLAGIPQDNETVIHTTFSPITVTESTDSGVNLSRWIRPNEPLVVTPIDQCYAYPNAMRNRCRRATPRIDLTILNDLKRAFHDPPTVVLSEIIRACQWLPYWIRNASGQLVEQAKIFQSINSLTEEELEHICRINQQVTLRASYGVLFLQGNRFFAKTIPNGKQRRSAIKGYPILKSDGQWEQPWETARRMTAQQVQYWNNEQMEWQSFELDEHTKDNDRPEYLECLVTSVQNTELLRYIGLFIIRLKPDIRIGMYGSDQTEGQDNWYPIEQSMNDATFYTIRPFLKSVSG